MFGPRKALIGVFVVGLVTAALHAETPNVPEKIGKLMQDRKYAEAMAAIEKAAGDDKADQDYLAYLNGRALHFQKKYDEAVAAYDIVSKRFPDSPWARRARFAKGLSYARKGDFRNAELTYRAEAEYLFSVDRKQEIADIYLEYAGVYFKPPKEEQKPDYKRALDFYQRALKVGPKPEIRVGIGLRAAQCQQELGNHDEAAEQYRKFISEHEDHALVVEARFRLGETLMEDGESSDARAAWQDLLHLHKGSTSDLLPQAAFKISETYSIPSPNDDEQLSLGVASLRSFLERYPEHELAAEAHLRIGQSYHHVGRYEDGTKALTQFLADKRYAGTEQVPAARNLLGHAYKMQGKFDEALAAWKEFLGSHPTHQSWSEVQQEIVNTEFAKAADRHRKKDYDGARQLWSEFQAKHPLDERNRSIQYHFGQMNFAQEKWDAAIADWRRLVSKYPGSQEASRAQFMIAVALEEKLGKLDEALKEYRKVTSGDSVKRAKRRIARLTAKTMKIATERVFRSDETSQLKLTTRNIETVTVRVYAVDMETYFRKMHLARGVEGLDIALIDPDKTFEFKIPDYKQYQRHESFVDVPLPAAAGAGKGDTVRRGSPDPAEKPDRGSQKAPGDLRSEKVARSETGHNRGGVMAVTVSSKTLEATTLVLQSDLDVIIKSSKDEAFVFAENMLTGKPWPKVRVLLSDGKQVFAEGETSDDGVFHKSFEELKSAENVRVFAVSGTHTASNLVTLRGLGVARGLSDKGCIYTDRPAYRPGQMVHLRGVIRKVADDTYTVAADKEYQVDVYDSRNRLVHDTAIRLSDFGSFHAHFLLTSAASQGDYRVLVHDEDRESYQGTFSVHDYKLEPIRLEIETPRAVYYRGEEIEGVIRATYYYGAPLVGRDIRYVFVDGRVHTEKTDDAGEIHFRLETRALRESQQATLTAQLTERNLVAKKNFYLSTQGFSLSAETVRDVYLAGETFELKVTAADAEGEPVQRPLTLSVLQQTDVDGEHGEVLVEEHDVETDEDGITRKTLQVEDGGRYTLRVAGVDRFKNPIETDVELRISDDEDKTRLRILADQHTFKVGDTASVQVHWREQPALALVAFQGAKILDYRLVELKKGANKLAIPMTAKLAPNFELSVAVMTDVRSQPDEKAEEKTLPRRFHAASSPFNVERELNVAVTVKCREAGNDEKMQPLQPGDEVEVSVSATDPQGKPITAELSLAMVEQALLKRFSSAVPAIEDFFRGAHRQSAVRTTSTITFAYRPTTNAINPRLLAEGERLAIAEEERRVLDELTEENVAAAGERGRSVELDGAFVEDWIEEEIVADDTADMAFFGAPQIDFDANGVAQFGGVAMGGQGGMGGGGFGGGKPAMGGAARSEGVLVGGYGLPGGPADSTQLDDYASNMRGFAGRGQIMLGKDALWDSGQAGGTIRLQEKVAAAGKLVIANGGVPAIANDGAWFIVSGNRRDEAQVEALFDQLAKRGTALLPDLPPHETGYWNPSIVTGEDGKATVTFELPGRSTGWSLLTKGVTKDTLAGEASHDFTVRKDLFGQLKLASAYTDGDRAQIVASVHNNRVDNGDIEVVVKIKLGDKTTTERKKLQVEQKGIEQLVFEQTFALPEEVARRGVPGVVAEFELTISAGDYRDVVRRTVPVRPYGMPVFSIVGGSAAGDVTAFVEQPEGMTLASPRLQVIVGPTIERSLLDAVLAPATWCQMEARQIASDTDSAVADLMASLALQGLLGATRDAAGPHAESLDARVRSSIGMLASLQNDDGGWGWASAGKKTSNRYHSARTLWAISLARSAGYGIADDAYDKAINFVQTKLSQSAVTDYETKIVLLHALTVADHSDFRLANQFYRNRQSLTPAALAYLALTYAEMDRKQTAGELLGLLGKQDWNAGSMALNCWNSSTTEVRAIYALGLEKVTPSDGRLKEQIDWLMANRTGHRWSPDKATGPAMLAACRWFARSQFKQEKYKLTVFVNDLLAKELEIDADSHTQTIDVPAELLAENGQKQRVRFELNGRGRFSYQCVLGGFVPSDELKSTTSDWQITRYYRPAQKELDGRVVPRGFDVAVPNSYEQFRNELSNLPVGRRGLIELHVRRNQLPSNVIESRLPYLVVTEPLPAGTAVVENSARGGFERFDISPGAITFYIGSHRSVSTISYQVHGYVPGVFRTTPTLVRDAFRPDQMAVAKPKSLTVLPTGEESSDPYRLTPRELYELGQRHFEKGNLAQAAGHLNDLFNNWNLKPEFYKETVHMLLNIHLDQGPANQVVRYFEIIVEKFPDLEIPFAKLLAVADAYDEIGEYERSYLVFRAATEASFMRESRLAGFLESQDEFLRSVEVMSDLLRQYPPEPYLATATYALAQRVYAKAPEAASDAKLREKKITRVDLIRDAWSRLDAFLSAYPEDPAADEASFSLANALLDLELYGKAIVQCERYAARYTDSDFLDSFWYIVGYCHFASGAHDQALDMCSKVAEAKRKDKRTGRVADSPNKWQAIYILGQIHHSLGAAEAAIREYTRVIDRFVDAGQAIDYFARKAIELPEVTTFQPGKPVEVELKFRNVPSANVTVYRIDLMKYSLLRRNLSDITNINLAGIRPYHQATIELGDGKDYRDRTTALELPLKDEGAYLVVCRGDNLHTSGMVLVSPLALEIQEKSDSGRVRTTIRDASEDKYVSDVHVKVIGTRNGDFVSGETDLRGVFVADGIQGRSMILAQASGGRYAFFRGQTELGPPPAQEAPAEEADAEASPAQPAGKDALLEGLKGTNTGIQMEQQEQLDDFYDNSVEEGIGGGFGGGIF